MSRIRSSQLFEGKTALSGLSRHTMSTSTPTTQATTQDAQQKAARTAGYYLASLTLGLVTASLGPALSSLAERVSASLDEISILFTAIALGYLVGSLLAGRVYDRAPGHVVMGTVLAVLAVMMVLVPLAPRLWLLVGVMLLAGAASGMVDVGGNTLLVWLHGQEVGPFMNGLHFCFGLGAFASPVIVAQVVRLSGDINWAYWIIASLIAPVAVWILRLPSPAHINQGDDPAKRGSALMVVLIATVLLLYVGAESSMGGWIYSYATAAGLSNEAEAAYLTSVFWGTFTAGRLLSIPLVRQFSPRATLIAAWGGCLASVGAMVLVGDARLVLWLGTVGVGLSMAPIFPTMISFGERRMPITGQTTSWFFVGGSLGGMTLPWLIGQLFESMGPRATMSTILGDLALAAVTFGALLLVAGVQDGR